MTSRKATACLTDDRVYLPGLNGVRFLAALSVVLHHIEQCKEMAGLPNIFRDPFIYILGGLGVTLFFVLSGFLISFLLFQEEKVSGVIHVKNFYVRRILRIWPLYYLVIGLGLFVIPNFIYMEETSGFFATDLGIKMALILLLMPNVCWVAFGAIPVVNPLWSVGVEEQFYLVWPLVIKFAKKNSRLLVLFLIVVGMFVLRKGLSFLGNHGEIVGFGPEFKGFFVKTRVFFTYFRIDCMAIGGMGAYLLHHNKTGVLKIIFHKATQLVVYLMLFFLIWKGIELPLGSYPLYSVLFLVLIMNVSSNPGTIISLENPLFNYMGKISYGLYMYHVMIILMVLEVLKPRVSFDHLGSQFLLVGMVLLGLTGVASFSYHFFEKPFLSFKKRFTLVVSGDDAVRK